MIDIGLLTELRTAANRRLLPVLGQVMEKTDDALFDVWQSGGAGTGAQALFDALREMRRQRAQIEGSVGRRIGEEFDELSMSKTPHEEAPEFDADPGDLQFSLLDTDVLEEQLTCERLATAVERRHAEALGRLGRGLAQVLKKAELANEDLPLAPLKIARAWRDALAPVLESIEWRLVAMKHLERGLISDLGGVVDELNRLLQSRGIAVAPVAPRPRRPVMPVGNGAPRAPREAAGGWDGGDNQVPQRTFDPPLLPDGFDPGDFADAGPGPGYGGYRGGGEARNDGPDPVYEAMREMFAAYLGNARQAAAAGAPFPGQAGAAPAAPAAPRIDSASAVLVLSRLQRQPSPALLAAIDDRQVELVAMLRAEVVRLAVALGRAPADAQLESHDEQALTMVGLLFDTLLDQGHFSRDVRERFIRLYPPYAKVALLDRRLFAHKLHPARRLLNLLAESSDGNAGDAPAERELLTKVFSLCERLVDTFEEDVAVFTAAESEFSDFLSRHRRRIALAEQRAAEAQRGRERLEEARLEVTLELDSLVGKRQVPKPIGEFFRRDWTHHLTMVALRDGVDSDAFRDARAPGVKLWMALLACEAGAPPPTDLGEQLLPAMKSSGQSEDVARAALADVMAALRAAMPAPKATPAATVAAPSSPAAARPTTSSLTAPNRAAASPAHPESRTSAAVDRPAAAAVQNSATDVEEVDPEPPPQFELVSAAPEAPLLAKTSAAVEGDLQLDADTSRAKPELIEQVKALTVGTWVEFTQPDGSIQPAKLSWISPISSRMLFVNRRGLRMCTVSAEEMAALMADNKLSLRPVDPAFDRAMSQVLDQLRGGAGSAAPT